MPQTLPSSVRSQAGKRARRKGSTFERKICEDLRAIYDSRDWLEEYATADAKNKRRLLKSSNVRRGEQGKGAHEPDVVIEGGRCCCWLELQHANHVDFCNKLEQAERDVAETKSTTLPVVVYRVTGSPRISVFMRYQTLAILISSRATRSKVLPGFDAMGVTIDYFDFLEILSELERRRQG